MAHPVFTGSIWFNAPRVTADPTQIADGDVWFREDTGELCIVADGTTFRFTEGGGGGGGGGAPTNAEYVTLSSVAGLSAEAVLGTSVIMLGTLASRPAASKAGRLYYVTDSGAERWTRDNGAAWVDTAPHWAQVVGKPSTFTPSTHATSHQSGGSDAIKLDDLATPDDNTDLNATASAHGLLPKLSGSASDALRGDGSWGAVSSSTHATTHQDGGADEINVGGLSGTLADAQKVAVQEEGVTVGTRAALNFIGATVTAADDGANGRVNVTVSAVPPARSITAGAGLTGGGDLSADRTIDVAANADGSIVVNANDIQVGVLATDAQHGNRGGGSLHTVAVASGAAGFLSGTDKAKLDGLPSSAVPTTRTLTAGAGLTGGGDLSADRTIDVVAADGTITVNANSIQVGTIQTANVAANAIGDAQLRDSAARSVIGRSAATSGDPADITASADGQYLTRQGGTVGFSTIAAADLPAHATRHQAGGADPIKLDDLAAPDDNTDLDATTSAHGLLPKLGGGTTNFLRADGSWALPPGGGGGGAPLDAEYLVATSNGTLSAERVTTDTATVTWDHGTAGQAKASVPNDAITFAKMQNIATDRLVGRDTALSGDPEELTVGGGLEFTGTGGIQRSALTGDVTASAGSGSTTIAAGVVTLAKMADLATDRLVGRDTAGTGVPESLTVGGGVEFSGAGGIQRSALTGDVTATAGSNSTTIANNAVTTAKVNDAAITFAKIQDITTDRLLGRDTAATGDVEELTVGGGLEFSGAGGIQRSALTGDVTASAGSNSTTIANNAVTTAKVADAAVTLAKMADLATDRLVGRDTAGTGVPESLTVGGGVEFTGTGGIQRSALTGDVTASAGSNATTVAANAVTDTKLRDSAALSVIGRSANSTGDPADIAAGSDGDVLRRSGTTLGFGTIATAGIANDAVTFAKIQNIATDRLLGRDTAATGDVEELTVGGGLEFTGSTGIQRSALTGDVTASAGSNSTTIAADAVTFAKMQNVATDSLIGRDTSGTGDPEAITLGASLEFSGSGTIQRAALTGDATASANSNAITVVAASGAFALTGDISPSQITADQNDYNPASLSIASTLRLTSDASRNVTGLAGGADGRMLIIHNVGAQDIVLKDESASSTAANRFALPSGDITIAADDSICFRYDSTSTRWRPVSRPAAAGGGGGAPTTVEYLVAASDAGLSAERVTTDTATVAWDHGTSGQAKANVPDNAITFAKMADVATDRLVGRDTAGTGDPEALTVGGGLEFTGSGGIQRSALTGDVTASAGSNSTTIANDAVTYAKMQNIATGSVIGRSTASTGDPETITVQAPLTISGGNLDFDETAALGNNARVGVRKNSAGSTYTRRRLNLIEGSGVTLTVADDGTDEEVDVTIAASGGGGGSSVFDASVLGVEIANAVTQLGVSDASGLLYWFWQFGGDGGNMLDSGGIGTWRVYGDNGVVNVGYVSSPTGGSNGFSAAFLYDKYSPPAFLPYGSGSEFYFSVYGRLHGGTVPDYSTTQGWILGDGFSGPYVKIGTSKNAIDTALCVITGPSGGSYWDTGKVLSSLDNVWARHRLWRAASTSKYQYNSDSAQTLSGSAYAGGSALVTPFFSAGGPSAGYGQDTAWIFVAIKKPT